MKGPVAGSAKSNPNKVGDAEFADFDFTKVLAEIKRGQFCRGRAQFGRLADIAIGCADLEPPMKISLG